MYLRTRFILAALLPIVACGSESTPVQSNTPTESPSAAISADRLRDAANDSPARAFYDANGWQAVWDEAAESSLRRALGDRARHGLDRLAFLDAPADDPAGREVALTEAALGYASALADGVIDPNALYDIYTIPRPDTQAMNGLAEALESGSLGDWLAGLAPRSDEYAALSHAYLRARDQAGERSGRAIADGALIRTGDTDPRVPRIVEALSDAGYLDPADGPARAETLYSARIAGAVERLQQDRGIAADGIVGPDTLQALNSSAADRARAAAVALERRRWLERTPPPTRIDVNTAATRLAYVRDGAVVERRKVIAGQPDWTTPQLQSPIYRLVANPTWTVPRSIEEAELADVGPAGLRQRNMVRRDGWIVQLPGPQNALGPVKFDMANDHAIYLHDTPADSLFHRNLRQLSHGCVRIENALEFARLLAEDQGIAEQWRSARGGGEDTMVRLPDEIPVRLLYHPTFVTASGEVRFVQDVYGWNSPIGERLGFGAAETRRFVPDIDDLGP